MTLSGNLDLVQVCQGLVNSSIVLLDHGFTALAVGFLDGILDGGDGFIFGQHTADREEAGLHNGVDAAAHANFFGDIVSIDHVEFEILSR